MFDSVPQLQQPGNANRRMLTSSQHSELEMARRRAEKAAEGKRANAEAAKQRFKRKKGERAEAARVDTEERQGNEEIEHKLSIVEDQKEAKRLKRCNLHPLSLHTAVRVWQQGIWQQSPKLTHGLTVITVAMLHCLCLIGPGMSSNQQPVLSTLAVLCICTLAAQHGETHIWASMVSTA